MIDYTLEMRVWVRVQLDNPRGWNVLRAKRDYLVTDIVQNRGNVEVKRELVSIINKGLVKMERQYRQSRMAA